MPQGESKAQTCVIRGVEISFEIIGNGNGTPIVITPGGGGGSNALRWLAQKLKHGRKVIIWDRRGAHPFSPTQRPPRPSFAFPGRQRAQVFTLKVHCAVCARLGLCASTSQARSVARRPLAKRAHRQRPPRACLRAGQTVAPRGSPSTRLRASRSQTCRFAPPT